MEEIPVLEYRSPQPAPPIDWLSRYAAVGPFLAMGHCILRTTILFLADFGKSHLPLTNAWPVLSKVLDFPVFTVAGHRIQDLELIVAFTVVNSIIWGFGIVGGWHMLTTILRDVRWLSAIHRSDSKPRCDRYSGK